MRRPLVVANWKMNGTRAEAARFLDELLPALHENLADVEGAVAPPFTLLSQVGVRIQETALALAAQDLHPASHGAFTGEISGAMLADLGVRYVIVGHSERRRLLGESDELIGRKVLAARTAGLVPILCVGEDETERREGRTLEVVERQLRTGLERTALTPSPLVIAYEPVWAIGTGRTATGAQAAEVHESLRRLLTLLCGGEAAAAGTRILYGGSVTAETIGRFVAEPEVDGALVGGASLRPDSFRAILDAVCAAP